MVQLVAKEPHVRDRQRAEELATDGEGYESIIPYTVAEYTALVGRLAGDAQDSRGFQEDVHDTCARTAREYVEEHERELANLHPSVHPVSSKELHRLAGILAFSIESALRDYATVLDRDVFCSLL